MRKYRVYIESALTGKILVSDRSTKKGALIIATKKYNRHQQRIDACVMDNKGNTIFLVEAKYK